MVAKFYTVFSYNDDYEWSYTSTPPIRLNEWLYTSIPPIRLHGVVLSKSTGKTLPLPLRFSVITMTILLQEIRTSTLNVLLFKTNYILISCRPRHLANCSSKRHGMLMPFHWIQMSVR
jgi:hypothetical protein